MKKPESVREPETLTVGMYYERWEWDPEKGSWELSLVQLVDYACSPDMVIVRNVSGRIVQIPRSELGVQPEEAS